MKRARWWAAPALAVGRNPLAAYFLSVGLDRVMSQWSAGATSLKWTIYERVFAAHIESPEAASLAYAAGYVLLWTAIVMAMRPRRIFLAA